MWYNIRVKFKKDYGNKFLQITFIELPNISCLKKINCFTKRLKFYKIAKGLSHLRQPRFYILKCKKLFFDMFHTLTYYGFNVFIRKRIEYRFSAFSKLDKFILF